MDDIKRRLRIVMSEAAGVNGRYMPLSLQLLLSTRALQTPRGYVVAWQAVTLSVMLSVPLVARLHSVAASQKSRPVEVKLKDEATGKEAAVCKVGKIVEKGMEEVGLRMEDVVLSPAAIALAVLEEQKESEEAEEEGKEGGKEGEEKGEEHGKREEDERIKQETEKKLMEINMRQKKDKIIHMRERKILELSEKYNAEMKNPKGLFEAIKEKAELIVVGIEKEKKRRT
ncbi:uncharacterized protein MONOS_4609 [Monocercomonoides exilis]|uniref:uncharacterized protein n=1 Tax=Monocercomonoides exilis TaxID=2049356 RepID=UPI003559ED1E|nr:hypothetical protein MONOS_4609 [Monocercomonoides exilis]|eukprot:MONOS_4609.1-p1 / transcript=MONOS_4609.1 / gene=MONOS_4609 / organism=Monocercomonoides_exilis_PA203 / gene_product=unspecified product / transcript_product=unspecified product / location=Mono_scaffold00124:95420-96290(+) / protein_length=228 / sequence_SO=supercontig / SO=protein_coding / is_pseudo=false